MKLNFMALCSMKFKCNEVHHVSKTLFKFGFNKREYKLKYRQPEFVCPFYSKGPYWYYYTYISVMYLNRPCSFNYHLGKSFEAAVAKLNSV